MALNKVTFAQLLLTAIAVGLVSAAPSSSKTPNNSSARTSGNHAPSDLYARRRERDVKRIIHLRDRVDRLHLQQKTDRLRLEVLEAAVLQLQKNAKLVGINYLCTFATQQLRLIHLYFISN